ncbi:MAG: hypothetical protein ACPLRX_02050 [Candidatus Saccharicenans sp.]
MAKIETREKKNILHIDISAGLGREVYVNKRADLKTPSLFSSFEDERTQKYINASFLPFFALLSIPPSFN